MNHVRITRSPMNLRLPVRGVLSSATAVFPSPVPHATEPLARYHRGATAGSSDFGDVWDDGDIACLGGWTTCSTFDLGIYRISNPAGPQLLTVNNYGSGLHILSLANLAAHCRRQELIFSNPPR